jgi:hypothetical protein
LRATGDHGGGLAVDNRADDAASDALAGLAHRVVAGHDLSEYL